MNEISLWKRLLFIILTVTLIFAFSYIAFTWRAVSDEEVSFEEYIE